MSEKALREVISHLRNSLEMERRNQPFHNEIAENFEAALGPHPIYSNGCWIVRAKELREERDSLRKEVERLNNLLIEEQFERHERLNASSA